MMGDWVKAARKFLGFHWGVSHLIPTLHLPSMEIGME
jgi:hypothetical protein